MGSEEIRGIAFEKAWGAYRLINNVAESSERREALKQFVRERCEAGATDAEAVAVAALIFLKQLDSSAGR